MQTLWQVDGINKVMMMMMNMKLAHWPLMGGLLHLVQQRGDWAGPQPTQPRCTKCNSPPINGQYTGYFKKVAHLKLLEYFHFG